MPYQIGEPFRDPELKPAFLPKRNSSRHRFSGFEFLNGIVRLTPLAEQFETNTIRVLSRIALGQTAETIAPHLDSWKTAGPGRSVGQKPAISYLMRDIRKTFGVKHQAALFPRVLSEGIMEIHPEEYAPLDRFKVTPHELDMISGTARDLTAEQVATSLDLSNSATVGHAYLELGKRVKFHGSALYVTAALMTHQLDPDTCMPIPRNK